jgi:Predicted lipoprotein of unknown function (DUF2380)
VGADGNETRTGYTATTDNEQTASPGYTHTYDNDGDDAGSDIEKYTIDLDKAAHRLKPGGLHTGKGAENWNGAWKEFFDGNPNASKQQILEKLAEMRKQYGLD